MIQILIKFKSLILFPLMLENQIQSLIKTIIPTISHYLRTEIAPRLMPNVAFEISKQDLDKFTKQIG